MAYYVMSIIKTADTDRKFVIQGRSYVRLAAAYRPEISTMLALFHSVRMETGTTAGIIGTKIN